MHRSILLVLLLATGCIGPLKRKDPNAPPKPYPNPVKMAVTWSPDTLTQVGRTPTRGFGARLFFYDEKSRAVPVEGTLIVHGFDESTGSEQPPVKRFEFTPEQFTRHFGRSDLGASYSVWIPWDAVGGSQTRVSLVASFVAASGKTIQGSPTIVMLPGKKTDADVMLADRLSPDYRKWQMAAAGDAAPSAGLTTTTIVRRDPAPANPIAPRPERQIVSQNQTGVDVALKRSKSNIMPASLRR